MGHERTQYHRLDEKPTLGPHSGQHPPHLTLALSPQRAERELEGQDRGRPAQRTFSALGRRRGMRCVGC